MAKKKDEPDVFDTAIAEHKAAEAVATETPANPALPSNGDTPPTNGFADRVQRHTYPSSPNPFGFENELAGQNRVHMLMHQNDRQRRKHEGSWVIRFAYNPNEDKGLNGEEYSKENPHPVLKMLKEEGFKWKFQEDGAGGWEKPFTGDPYYGDKIHAQKTLQKAVEMIGGPKEQGLAF